MEFIDRALAVAVSYAWGTPLIVLLVGGGLILTVYSRFVPFLRVRHALEILRGRYDSEQDPGDITHFQALSTHLSATIGMGNISGVAIAITQGGPGAVFWMWLAALVGMATKFFTCTLAVLYRGRDSRGQVQGGPMYYIEEGLGKRARPLAIFFCLCGMIGCLGIFQANQVTEILHESYQLEPWMAGVVLTALTSVVVIGGVKRIARVASRMVPTMCMLYLLGAGLVVMANWQLVPAMIGQIFHDAFHGTAAVGGMAGISVMTVIQTGVKRAAFSNEAGIGTAPMAHGAAKTREPVREGLVAMIGPFVDTIIICSLTAFVILSSAKWQVPAVRGVSLTAEAFEAALGGVGRHVLMAIVTLFGLSTMFSYSYYGRKCFSYLFGAERARLYDFFYLAMIFAGAMWSVRIVVNLMDTSFALMAVPNMIAALVLAPRVMAAARDYFARHPS